ncbi:nucleic acid binding OB-fold tRNA/helicase-type [Halothece sp. PCC 7418]|uniref:hypothetical protein n=1 Tax=Halothece sp. (strain PCC 7418) TaxID=65093 RepID=UPI0002A08038|nr:hypothetical protein [Halothece sp. PCC 7418]AFZ44743.1 nucleic acid binding OB-fold tRNA/helicase-type [Halothece sp. PCC 7418]
MLLGLTACVEKTPLPTPIAELDRKMGTSVYVQGIVRDRAPLLNQTAYQLQDDTGQIWVITTDSAPESGQTVTIQAKIKSTSIVLHQQRAQELYLQEVQTLP